MKKIKKFIDTHNLPVCKKGIDWKNSIGYKCKFKYDDVEGEVEIVDYNNSKLTIKYLDYDLFEINTGHFRKCKLGELLNKNTKNFKIKNGTIIKDDKRDLTIIDREYRIKNKNNGSKVNEKYYKYHCNKCGNEDWIEESHLLNYGGCNACCKSPQKVVLGINTIWDKARWMCDLGVSKEDAKKLPPNYNKKIKVICPNCGKEKYTSPNAIHSNKSICCSCGDGTSYPEKFVISLLNQLNINYITQYSPNWSNNKRYDFYFELDNKKYIIETHGLQHYTENGFNAHKENRLRNERQNDKYKKEIALTNGINTYIELDCRKSKLEYIKNSIINSELNKTFDLSNIDWLKCEEFALNNRIKEVCDYWKLHNNENNEELTTGDLGKIFNLNSATISNYLKRGNYFNWCNYNAKEEMLKITINTSKINKSKLSKKVEVFKNGQSLGVFESCNELSRKSYKLFGVKLSAGAISLVARKKQKQHKGYTFEYIKNI